MRVIFNNLFEQNDCGCFHCVEKFLLENWYCDDKFYVISFQKIFCRIVLVIKPRPNDFCFGKFDYIEDSYEARIL